MSPKLTQQVIAQSVERLTSLGLPMTRDLHLAPGIRRLPWGEFERSFGVTAERQMVIARMRDALETARLWDGSAAWVGGDLVSLANGGGSSALHLVLDIDHVDPVARVMRGVSGGEDVIISVAALKSGAGVVESDDAIRMASIDPRTGVRRGLVELILNDVLATPRR